MRRWAVPALAAWALVACVRTAPAPEAPPPAVPAGFPAAAYLDAAAHGAPVFRVEPQNSLVVVRVYRAGPLAHFGHDHVMASRDVRGYVRLASAGRPAGADLYAPLASLSVDEPALRAEAGFDTQPSQADIDGTRHNMLDKVLDAGRYPFVSLHLGHVRGAPPAVTVDAAVTLHGRTYTLPVAVRLETPSADTLYARGHFSVRQTDFGLVPYSLFGGALKVRDRVDIRFDLSAARITRPPS